jgi:hypothetical protein
MRRTSVVLVFLLVLCHLQSSWATEKNPKTRIAYPIITTTEVKASPDPTPAPATKLATNAQPMTVPVVGPPEAGVVDPIEHTNLLVKAVRSKEWGVAAGLALMLIVWVIGWFWSALPSAWVPFLAIALGILATVGIDLSIGGVWWRAILNGFATGLSATGCWETFGKQLFGSRKNALAKKAIKAAKKA